VTTILPTGNHDVFGGGFGGGIIAENIAENPRRAVLRPDRQRHRPLRQRPLPDVTYNSITGALQPISETQLLAGVDRARDALVGHLRLCRRGVPGAKYNKGSASGFGVGNPSTIARAA